MGTRVRFPVIFRNDTSFKNFNFTNFSHKNMIIVLCSRIFHVPDFIEGFLKTESHVTSCESVRILMAAAQRICSYFSSFALKGN